MPAGSHLRHRHARQHPPVRPIPSQTNSEAPWSTRVERRTQTVLNQPTQTASSSLFETTSCRSTCGLDSGHPLIALRYQDASLSCQCCVALQSP